MVGKFADGYGLFQLLLGRLKLFQKAPIFESRFNLTFKIQCIISLS